MPWMSDAPVIQSSAFLKDCYYTIFGEECKLPQIWNKMLRVLNQTYNLEVKVLRPYKYILLFQFPNKYFLQKKKKLSQNTKYRVESNVLYYSVSTLT